MTINSTTDDLIAEIEAAAKACGDMALDTAEAITAAESDAHIECPICHGNGYAELESDYCNFDNHAIGVQFYGIGPEFGAGERYFRAASPANVLGLIARIKELEAREVDLPPSITSGDVYDSTGMDDEDCVTCAQMVSGAISACGSMVKAAGVRVKP